VRDCGGFGICGSFSAWMAVVMRAGLLPDYKYFFFVISTPSARIFTGR